MYLKNFNLCFVQVPNAYEKVVIEALTPFLCEEDDGMLSALHPERICEQIGFLASRKTTLFSVPQNTYDRLVYLYTIYYQDDPESKFHNFGEFIRYIYEGKISDTVHQMWYLHNIPNADVDNNAFRDVEIDELAVDDVFIDSVGVNEFLSDKLSKKIEIELPVRENKTASFYTSEIKGMVDSMYEKEISYFNFKYPK